MIDLYAKCPLIPYSTAPVMRRARKELMKPKYTFEIFKTKKGEWCVRVKHRNGRELFRYSETVKRRSGLHRSVCFFTEAIRQGNYRIASE